MQHLAATDPFTAVARDVMGLARIIHNNLVYHYRQRYFTRERQWDGLTGSKQKREKHMLPHLTDRELKGLVRGTHHYDAYGQVIEDAPGAKATPLLIIGGVWDRIEYDFKAVRRAHWNLLTKWAREGRIGPKPGLPDYHRGECRSVAYRAEKVRFSPDGAFLQFPQNQHRNGITLPPLRVPGYVQAALASGMAKLVEVQLQPLRDGGVSVQWTLDETGRGSTPFPDAPVDLAAAVTAGPVGSIDVGVGNLLALTITDLRTATGTLTEQLLPGSLLVRGERLEAECHQAGARIAHLQGLLPYQRGGTRGRNRVTSSTTINAAAPTPTSRRERSSRRINAAWEKHRLRKHHQVHAAALLVLQELEQSGARALVVGWNKELKQRLNLGRVQNARFGTIPYDQLRTALREGCARRGILYVEVGEAYTSKTSFADGEAPVKHASYAGRRVHRGLFVTGAGVRLNADVNASLQILTKALHENQLQGLLTPGVRGRVLKANLNPRSVHLDLGAPEKNKKAVPETLLPV